MEKCSIIIASYNEAGNLKKCLNSIRDLDYPKEVLEIIVVDNNSSDNTSEIVGQFPEVIYLKEYRQGAAFARNRGITKAGGKILVFLDADTTVDRNWLRQLTAPFEDPGIGAVGGAISPIDKNNIFSLYLGVSLFMRYPLYGQKREVRGYPSCNLAVRRELIDGGFDTSAFSTYGEDKDICYRILEKGFKVLFQPEAKICHRHPGTMAELFGLFVKSSAGRADFAKKYPMAPDILLFNLHIPLVYTLILLFALFVQGIKAFLMAASPALVYLLYSSTLSFMKSKDFLLSFVVKPLFDVLSVYIIYVSYQFRKLKRR